MSCAKNIVTAFFNGGRTATTAPLYQWDYGQVLRINGLTLPAAFQVHFSNSPRSGTTTTSIGQDEQVTIPDVYLTKGLPVYAFIFLHNSEDDGETEYVITIPVNARPRPTDEEPTPEQQSEINQLIDALNNGVERAETAADSAEASATASQASADESAGSATTAAQKASEAATSAGNAALSAQTAAQSAIDAAASATESAQSAADADTSADRAEQSATAAAASATAASGSAIDSAASATAAEEFAGNASTAAGNASQAAQNASQSATAASGFATAAGQSATAAAGSATTAGNKASEAAQSATEAAGSATTAGTAATDAQTAQEAAETAQTAAETAQGAAEDAAESVEGKAAQIDQNTEDISLLKSHLNATDIVDTASGAIASFPDGANGIPVESLTVSMEPIQDLHGQANPYPAGGGKNLLNPALFVEQAGWYIIELTLTPNTAYTMSSNMPLAKADELPVYFKTDNIGGGNAAILVYTGHPVTQTSDENGHLYISERRVSGTDVFSNYQWQIELGSTATTYAPYSNICPISGRQSVTVWRTGKNLFDLAEYTAAGATEVPDSEYPDTFAGNKRNFYYLHGRPDTNPDATGLIPRKPYGCLTISFYKYTTNNDRVYFHYTDSANWVNHSGNFESIGYKTFTSAANRICDGVAFYTTQGVTARFRFGALQIEIGDTMTAYESPNRQTAEVQLGDTVYGGTVDVTTGEMKVDYVTYVITANTHWTSSGASASVQYFDIPDFKAGSYYNDDNVKCNILPKVNSNDNTTPSIRIGANNKVIYVYNLDKLDSSITTGMLVRQWCVDNGLTITYPLATPLTVQLVGQSLTTLKGTNNIWSDGGDVSVDYVADTKLYIEQLTEPDADMIADANINSGQYFMVGNQLYLATANIASGASIVPGVNCTRTSLAAALNALNA